MILRAVFILVGIVAFVGGASRAVEASEIDVLEWTLRTDVDLGVLHDGRVESTVSNPLQDEYFASVGNSTAFSSINTAWDSAGVFSFLIEAEHAAEGSSLGFSRSTVLIDLTPAVDSILTLDLEYNYALGSGDRSTIVNAGVYQNGVGSVYSNVQQALPIGGDPRVGTHFDHQVIPLAAGVEYGIGGTLEIRSFSGSPTNLSHADGHMRFSIVPVPEPTCLCLILLIASVLRRRGRALLR